MQHTVDRDASSRWHQFVRQFANANEELARAVDGYADAQGIRSPDPQSYLAGVAAGYEVEKSRRRSNPKILGKQAGDIFESMIRQGLEKALIYKGRIDPGMLRAVRLLDAKHSINIPLPMTTPSIIATQCLDWAESCLETRDLVYPISSLLKQLEEAVISAQPELAFRIYPAAEERVYFLIDFYTWAMCCLVKELCAAAHVASFTIALSGFARTPCPEVSQKVSEQCVRLSIYRNAFEIIESNYLPGKVCPQPLVKILENLQLQLAIASDSVNPARDAGPRYGPTSRLAEAAQKQVENFVHRARTVTNFNGERAVLLPRAQIELVHSLDHSLWWNRALVAKTTRASGRPIIQRRAG